MNSKIKKVIGCFSEKRIDALLITRDVNIQYLMDFPASESWLLITPKKVFYITDSRYVLEAREGLKGVQVKQYTKSIYELMFQLAKQQGCKRIGFDARYFSLEQYEILKKRSCSDIKLIKANNMVEDLREIKTATEVEKIKYALKLHRQAHQYLKKIVRPGLSEKEILCKLERFVKSRGAGFSFDPIIASGPNSCYPHARVTDRKIKDNEPVLIDMGIDINGYKSDLTRMFFLGKMAQLVQDVNDFVFESQRRAIKKICEGVSASEIDRTARNFLGKNKLAKYFGHSLGHGVGLEIHENPRLSQKSTSILKEGMIITIEPGVYIPKKFGVRIEDMVLVKKQGYEILSDDIY